MVSSTNSLVALQALLTAIIISCILQTHGFQQQIAPPPHKRNKSIFTRYPSTFALASTNDDDDDIDETTRTEIRNIANHISQQTLESLLSPSEAKQISNELLFNNNESSSIFNDKTYEQYVKYWNKVVKRLREENQRTPADLLGNELTNRILSSIRGDGKNSNSFGADRQTVLTFLESPR